MTMCRSICALGVARLEAVCMHGSTRVLVHKLVGGSRICHISKIGMAISFLGAIESVWAHGVCKYLLSATIGGVMCPSPVCEMDCAEGTCMAESPKWALWTQVCLLYVKGTWFGDTSWAAAKNGERRTRRGRDKPLPIICFIFC